MWPHTRRVGPTAQPGRSQTWSLEGERLRPLPAPPVRATPALRRAQHLSPLPRETSPWTCPLESIAGSLYPWSEPRQTTRLVKILERPAGQQFTPFQGPLESVMRLGSTSSTISTRGIIKARRICCCSQPADQLPQSERKVRSRERLGGLLRFYHRKAVSTPAENCTFMAGENCTPDDWVTNPKTPAPPGISCER